VASAGQYANLHLTPDRQPCQHPTTQFLQARCPFCCPTSSIKALKAQILNHISNLRNEESTENADINDQSKSTPNLILRCNLANTGHFDSLNYMDKLSKCYMVHTVGWRWKLEVTLHTTQFAHDCHWKFRSYIRLAVWQKMSPRFVICHICKSNHKIFQI